MRFILSDAGTSVLFVAELRTAAIGVVRGMSRDVVLLKVFLVWVEAGDNGGEGRGVGDWMAHALGDGLPSKVEQRMMRERDAGIGGGSRRIVSVQVSAHVLVTGPFVSAVTISNPCRRWFGARRVHYLKERRI